MGWKDPGAAFTAIVQIGTMLALIIYFFDDIIKFITFGIKSILHKNLFETPESKQAWMIVIGTIPIVVFGFAYHNFFSFALNFRTRIRLKRTGCY